MCSKVQTQSSSPLFSGKRTIIFDTNHMVELTQGSLLVGLSWKHAGYQIFIYLLFLESTLSIYSELWVVIFQDLNLDDPKPHICLHAAQNEDCSKFKLMCSTVCTNTNYSSSSCALKFKLKVQAHCFQERGPLFLTQITWLN